MENYIELIQTDQYDRNLLMKQLADIYFQNDIVEQLTYRIRRN